ncbi:PREDICTED: uncharacterized protein DDB_G0283697 isoform X2 [Tarenaya hassleriana]|uniref:uncharacterized protein DDB_G0283697 isoform X2 n=1 Tax=Tarenaya hassleriana TaxID=28532 RepID=UPI00053C084F|nr:PREDICTED: uncharacterized protein DDB_G0283697 isoform X2 [Tarenaya hassleriana]
MASGGGEDRESSSSGEGSEELNNVERKGNISEYEKQRLSRIAENKARMEALGLSKAASGLMCLSPGGRKHRGKAKSGEEDDDYRPGEADDDDDDEDGEYEEDDDKDEEFLGHIRSGSGKRKVKNKGAGSKKKKNVSSKMNVDNARGYIEEDDDEDNLRKAIELSLKDTLGGGPSVAPSKRNIGGKESGNGKKKKPFVSRLQMTEDELIIYFYQFDVLLMLWDG